MAIEPTPEILLVCDTRDRRDDGAPHALHALTPTEAAALLAYRDVFRTASEPFGAPHTIEFFRGGPSWGRVPGFASDGDFVPEWHRVPGHISPEAVEPVGESTELGSVKVYADGVSFSACWKNDDSGAYFESAMFMWDELERASAASTQAELEAVFGAGTFDLPAEEEYPDEDPPSDETEEAE